MNICIFSPAVNTQNGKVDLNSSFDVSLSSWAIIWHTSPIQKHHYVLLYGYLEMETLSGKRNFIHTVFQLLVRR